MFDTTKQAAGLLINQLALVWFHVPCAASSAPGTSRAKADSPLGTNPDNSSLAKSAPEHNTPMFPKHSL